MSTAKRTRISLELDAELVKRLDEIAAHERNSRSSLVESACRRLLQSYRSPEQIAAADEAYAESYRHFPEEPTDYQVAVLAEVLPKEDW